MDGRLTNGTHVPTYPVYTDSPAARAELAGKLDRLGALLDLKSDGIAAVLRNPGESYPDGALVRLARSQRQAPSARFVWLVNARLAEVESQLKAGIQAVVVAGRYLRVWHVEDKEHVITLMTADELADVQPGDSDALAAVVTASLSVPADWISRCKVCGRLFLRRSTRQVICRRRDERGRFPCVLAARRLNRAYKSVYGAIDEPAV